MTSRRKAKEAREEAERDRLSAEMEEADVAQQCVTCCHNEASHSTGLCFMCGCSTFVAPDRVD